MVDAVGLAPASADFDIVREAGLWTWLVVVAGDGGNEDALA